MDLSNLKPAKGSIQRKGKRIGRGQGSGKGGTATRGHNGQKSRSGYSKKIGFEGGQMPIQRRVPKYGFKNINRIEYRAINLDLLQELVENKKVKEVNLEVLIKNGLAHKNDRVKILGRGELKGKLDIIAHSFSGSAKTAIEKAGGTVQLIDKYGNEIDEIKKKEHKNRKKKKAKSAPKSTKVSSEIGKKAKEDKEVVLENGEEAKKEQPEVKSAEEEKPEEESNDDATVKDEA